MMSRKEEFGCVWEGLNFSQKMHTCAPGRSGGVSSYGGHSFDYFFDLKQKSNNEINCVFIFFILTASASLVGELAKGVEDFLRNFWSGQECAGYQS